MKKSFIIIGIIVIFLIGIISSFVSGYNSLVAAEEDVSTKYADVSVALERRSDLIPNLVKTVKGYAKHEEEVIKKVTDARKDLQNADNIEEISKANDKLSKAINSLLVIVENYPDLKANTNFINLQDELAGTENRIAVARRDYNGAVKVYNTKTKKIPTNIIASICNFKEKRYFTVSDGKSEVPNIEF